MTIVEILKELRIDLREQGQHHHVTSGRVQIDCTWCSPRSGKFRMGLMLDNSRPAACWSCGFHNVAKTLAEASGKRWGEINKLLSGVFRTTVDDKTVVRGKLVLPANVGPLLPAHRRYLKDRGFDPDQLETLWGIKGIGPAADLAWRVFIPIQDVAGETVSWTTRKIASDDGAKYWNAKPNQESVAAKSLLYGEAYCRHAVIVHEGPIDPWATGPGAIATMGLVVTKAQLVRISKYPVRCVCFDSEPDARRRAEKLCDELAPFPGKTVLAELDSGKDAGEAIKTKAGRRELRKLRKFLE